MANSRKKYDNMLLVDIPMDVSAFILWIAAVLTLSRLAVLYVDNTEYTVTEDSIAFIFRGLLALGGVIAFKLLCRTKAGKHNPVIENLFNKDSIFDALYCTVSYFAIQAIVLAIQATFFQVEVGDVYGFFLSAAVIEEWLYRALVVMMIQWAISMLLRKAGSKSLLLPNILAIVLSALLFMYVHEDYRDDIFLMSLTFLGGCSQAFWFIKARGNLLIPILAHGTVNWASSKSLAQSLK